MDKKYLLISIIFLLASLGFGCISQNAAGPSEKEDYAVYHSLISCEFFRKKTNVREFEFLAICDHTSSIDSLGNEEKVFAALYNEPYLNEEIIENFKSNNIQKVHLKDLFHFSKPHLLIDEKMLATLSCKNYWTEFYKQFPKTQGIIFLSKVGYNRAGNKALVYLESMSGDLWGYGGFFVLEKKWGGWKVVDQAGCWVS